TLGLYTRYENLLRVTRLRQLDESLETDQFRVCGRDERRERGRRHVRHVPEQLDVFRVVGEFVVADQCAVRLAARRAELALIELLEGLALVEFDGLRQVLE